MCLFFLCVINDLIPLDITLCLTPLFPLQVLEDAGTGTDGEVVVFVHAKGRQTAGHRETVQIPTDIHGCLRNLFGFEIISRGEVECPFVGNLNVAGSIQVVCVFIGITHGMFVDGTARILTDVERIVE